MHQMCGDAHVDETCFLRNFPTIVLPFSGFLSVSECSSHPAIIPATEFFSLLGEWQSVNGQLLG